NSIPGALMPLGTGASFMQSKATTTVPSPILTWRSDLIQIMASLSVIEERRSGTLKTLALMHILRELGSKALQVADEVVGWRLCAGKYESLRALDTTGAATSIFALNTTHFTMAQ